MASYNSRPLLRSVFGEGSVYEQLDTEDNAHAEISPRRERIAEEEEDVPESLLVDPSARTANRNSGSRRVEFSRNGSKGGNKRRRNRVGYENGLTVSTPLNAANELPNYEPASASFRSNLKRMDPKERAMWKWANTDNLDNFLVDAYSYFLGSGIYCILLSRAVNMATLLFVVAFATYLSSCIDYSKLSHSSTLSEIKIPRCMSKMGIMHTFTLWLFSLFWFLKVFQYLNDIRRLVDMKNFYHYLLDIPDSDMQTVSWQQVVNRIMHLREQNLNNATNNQRMDPHIIANRIMRRENYIIAMINKDVLDLCIPLPLLRKNPFLSKTLEWHISLCIMDFAFNDQGQLRPVFLKETHRRILSDGLRRRFLFAGVMNIVFSPFIILYLTLLYFFRYFNEYHKDPSSLGTRQYTPLAEWKMREFNELYHLFKRRLNLSYDYASKYVNQFPKEKTTTLARFVTFIAGSFAAVLGIVSLIDPDIFLGFEITKDRTVLFYIGLFGSIAAVGRSLIPSESLVFDPETTLKAVAEYTHYLPKEWEGHLHTDWVKSEFSSLYDLKLMIILKEVLSVVLAPFILWFSLPKSCDRIVDFFRDFSVYVDGMGYVCSFAVFDFNQPTTNLKKRPTDDPRQTYYNSNGGKMLKSYLNFVDSYGGAQNDTRNSIDKVKSKKQLISQDNLENSVMGRFHQMQASSYGSSDGGHVETGMGRSLFAGSKQLPQLQTDNESNSFGSFSNALNDGSNKEETSEPAEDGGVLGLLNEFYKQAGTGTGNA
ncbi:hypothetical protein TRICI_005458 [Trichomonascus ciferrii]|uniref:Autophagy-related protein 9 n=1 Tax=Trichomonascus ciferrii TaxID=44093 RepID=A0A642UX50_9ASCO|nr:hypothetical protein TRICI_005458 [Trichomonascus ciferrii]